jgi:competence protein ComEC
MRRVIILPFTFFLSGILLYYNRNYILLSAVLAALFFIFYYKKSKYMTLFCIAFIFTGILAASINTYINNYKYEKLTNQKSYMGIISERENNTYTIVNYKNNYKIKFAVYENINIKPGDYLFFKGQIQPRPDYRRRIDNIYGVDAWAAYNKGSIEIKKSNDILSIPFKIKYKLTSAFNKIDSEGGAFISGLICGYTGDISKDNIDNFKKLGISHILAVSGFNLAIIYYFVSLIFSKISKRIRIPLTLSICLIYSLICGFEPSITRAFIMISVSALAGITNKTYNVINSLIVTAFIMLCSNTLYIFNIGFLLSYTAASGIILLNQDIAEKIPRIFIKVKNEISVTLSAFISTLPIIMFFNGYFSILSVIVNIIIAPIVSAVTILGFVSALLYLVTSFEAVLYPVSFCGIFLVKAVNMFSKYSLTVFSGRPLLFFIILYYIFVLIVFKYIVIKCSKKMMFYLKFSIVILLILSLLYRSPEMRIHFINVGQGDCIFVETPHGSTILIDTGPGFSNYIAARDKVIPYINKLGYNKIDMLFISHFHNDHSGGLKYLLENFNIKYLFSYEIPKNYINRFSKVSKGDKVIIDGVAVNILYPDDKEIIESSENETGLVMEINYNGFKILLTADAEKNVMDILTGSYDILKVPHHGSINSLSTEMLESSQIGASVISVGKNSFGHPSEVFINELKKCGSNIYRTDLQGDIIVRTNGEKYEISTEAE